MPPAPAISLTSLRGGLDDTTPVAQMPKDACTFANNVEWFWSTIGERRQGCEPYDIAGSGLDSYEQIVHVSQWFPTNQVRTPEIWFVGTNPDTDAAFKYKTTAGLWSAPPTPVDAIDPAAPQIYEITTTAGPSSLSPNGKLFVQYPNAGGSMGASVNRSHVWDPNNGSTLRRTGIAQPDPPTLGNGIVWPTPATKRYYRVREVRQAGTFGQVTVRSEPSTSVAFTPNGTNAPRITAPTFDPDESGTHWEVEGSFNDVDFYVLQSLVLATTFWDDTFLDPISFSEEGPLSEAIGAYLVPENYKYAGVDGDRLVTSGHWTDTSLMSTVWWTPVFTDPGAGNDERIPIVTTGGEPIVSSISLDNFSGGPITGQSTAISGNWYVFKWNRIYKLQRTNRNTLAYQSITMSTTRGAIPGSIFEGVDEAGRPAIYFLDPLMGPSMISGAGLRTITGLRRTWNRVNLNAANIIARGCFYGYKRQAHWWVATENADFPNYKLVNQTTELRDGGDGSASRGWSTATGRITEAFAVGLVTEELTVFGVTTLRERPFIGLDDPDWVQRCDGEEATDDAGVEYEADMTSAPIIMSGLSIEWGAMETALMASGNAGTTVQVSLIRQFGKEESAPVVVDLSPGANDEPFVIRRQDSLHLSESVAMQVRIKDPD